MHDFTQLLVWMRAREFICDAYRTTARFPNEERFGLTSQLRRAAVSIAANIAEGAGRESPGDFNRFLGYASGSASECHALVLVAQDLGLVDDSTATDLSASTRELQRMLRALMAAVR